jgi:hypothetical protein
MRNHRSGASRATPPERPTDRNASEKRLFDLIGRFHDEEAAAGRSGTLDVPATRERLDGLLKEIESLLSTCAWEAGLRDYGLIREAESEHGIFLRISPEVFASFWRRLAEAACLRRSDGLNSYRPAPFLLLREVGDEPARALDPEVVARLWSEWEQRTQSEELLAAYCGLTDRLRGGISTARVAEVWRRAAIDAPDSAVDFLASAPEDALAGIDPEQMRAALREYGKRDVRMALVSTAPVLGTLAERGLPDALTLLWRGGRESGTPHVALSWLEDARAEVQARLPVEEVGPLWRDALATDARHALDWWSRAPAHLRPPLGESDLAAAMQSAEPEVRLRAIALLSQLPPDASASPQHRLPPRALYVRTSGR